jgi:hypothetical protein
MNTVKPGQIWKYKGALKDLVSPYRQVRIAAYSSIADDSYTIESLNYPSMVFTISHNDFVNMWELDATEEALIEFDSDLDKLIGDENE